MSLHVKSAETPRHLGGDTTTKQVNVATFRKKASFFFSFLFNQVAHDKFREETFGSGVSDRSFFRSFVRYPNKPPSRAAGAAYRKGCSAINHGRSVGAPPGKIPRLREPVILLSAGDRPRRVVPWFQVSRFGRFSKAMSQRLIQCGSPLPRRSLVILSSSFRELSSQFRQSLLVKKLR